MASTAGSITTAATASYVQYSNVANKPTLVSGSAQISFTGITNKPTLVSGSAQITYSGVSGKPEGIVSSSVQVKGYNVFATTGSNQFNGSQAITGSLTVTGQVVAQTLNVQQVTSSIVYSSGSNIFGNNSGNTHQFTGSVSVTGSMAVNGAGTFSSSVTAGGIISTSGTGLNASVRINNTTSSTGKDWHLYSLNNGNFGLYNNTDGSYAYQVTPAGIATFTGTTVAANGSVNIESLDPAIRFRVTSGTANSRIYEWRAVAAGGVNDIMQLRLWDDSQSSATTLMTISPTGNITAGSATFSKSTNSGSGSTFPRITVKNTLATQGDGSSTFNFADINISSGNEAVNMFLATTYAAGTWAPAGIINVSTNHELQFKTNNTTRLTLANSGAATFGSSVTATRLTANADNSGLIVDVAGRHGFMKYFGYSTGLVGKTTGTDNNISTWIGRFSGSDINAPTGVFQDLVINNSGYVGIGTTDPSNHKLYVQGNLSMSGSGLVRTFFAQSTTLGAKFDIFRFLNDAGSLIATGGISGILFLNASDTATGGNQISYTFHFQTNGNGTSQANLTQMSFQLRGTQPITSIGLENDGGGGGVKVVANVVGSGVSGCRVYATFVGTAV
jgi:hypothetical protein